MTESPAERVTDVVPERLPLTRTSEPAPVADSVMVSALVEPTVVRVPVEVTSREVPAEDELRVTSPVTEAKAEVAALSVRKSASVLVMVTEPVVAEAERSAVEMSEPVAA